VRGDDAGPVMCEINLRWIIHFEQQKAVKLISRNNYVQLAVDICERVRHYVTGFESTRPKSKSPHKASRPILPTRPNQLAP